MRFGGFCIISPISSKRDAQEQTGVGNRNQSVCLALAHSVAQKVEQKLSKGKHSYLWMKTLFFSPNA